MVLEQVIIVPSLSNRTPIIPRGSVIPSKPSTINCFGITSMISLSGGMEMTCAPSITLVTSSSPISHLRFEQPQSHDMVAIEYGYHRSEEHTSELQSRFDLV